MLSEGAVREEGGFANPHWINRKKEVPKDPHSAGTCRPNPNPHHVLFSSLPPCLGNFWNPRYTVAVLYHFQVHDTLISAEPDGEKYAENQSGTCWNPSQFIGACI